MDQKYQLPFKTGQTVEARCWEDGYRRAWFRCKIKKIDRREGELIALLDYFDYPDEKWTWTDLYQEPPCQSRESEETRQLMLRPEYPPVHLKNEMSNVSLNSEVTLIVDGTWKEGDLVDWWVDNCYWSGKVTKLLCNDKAEIELMPPPLGEGSTYEVFIKDLRPSLNWSPKFGWLVPASQDSESARPYPQLLKLINQGEPRRRDGQTTTGSSSKSSFSTRLSGHLSPKKNRFFRTSEFVDSEKANDMSNQISLESDALDASILALEELANGIHRLKAYMDCERPLSDGVTPSWKSVKHHGRSIKK